MSKVVVCSASPTSNLHCVEDRVDIAFFAAYDLIEPETKHYFQSAKAYLSATDPMVVQSPASDLRAIIEALNTGDRKGLPWGIVYIFAHANPTRWFIHSGGPDPSQTLEELVAIWKKQQDGDFSTIDDPVDAALKKERDAELDAEKRGAEPPPEQPPPDPHAMPIDPDTKIVLKCCDLGVNREMLRMIRLIFNSWPDVYAPLYSVFFGRKDGALVERLFYDIGPAVIPGDGRTPPFTPAERDLLRKQLEARYYKHSKAGIKDLVENGNTTWREGANQEAWAMTSEVLVTNPLTFMLNERSNGDLFVTSRNGEETALQTKGGAGVSQANLRAAYAEAYNHFHPDVPFENLKASNWVFQEIPGDAQQGKAHRVSASLSGTVVAYHLLVKDSDGTPAALQISPPAHYGVSMFSDR